MLKILLKIYFAILNKASPAIRLKNFRKRNFPLLSGLLTQNCANKDTKIQKKDERLKHKD